MQKLPFQHEENAKTSMGIREDVTQTSNKRYRYLYLLFIEAQEAIQFNKVDY